MNGKFAPVIEKVDLLLTERRQLVAMGPHFKIVHRFRRYGTDCRSGEEVSWVIFLHRSREYLLRLSLSLRLLFDYFARTRNLPQSAIQIVAAMRADDFYVRHGTNVKTGRRQTRKFSPSGVKVYVERLRRQMHMTFREAGLKIDPFSVLVSEPTDTNEIHYRLKATVEWVHV